MDVYIVIAEGGDGSNSLLDRVGLCIEGVFVNGQDADTYATMGDMEVHVLPLRDEK
jgi:hypothetical protein